MNHRILCTVLVCLMVIGLLPGVLLAQETEGSSAAPAKKARIFGAAIAVNKPYNELYQEQSTGYGIHGIMDYPFVPLLDITADIGWNRFPGSDDNEDIDIWEFAGGLRFVLGVFFMSGEVGYYTKIEETSFLPGMGLRFDHWEFSVRAKATSGGNWTGFRFGYYF